MALMDEANDFDPTQDLADFHAEREQETQARRVEVLDQFRTARRKAVGNLHLVATEVAATQEDEVAGTELAAKFYEHVANGLANTDIAGTFSTQIGANQAQVIELETVRGQLDNAEQELEAQRSIQEQLRESAREASDLQAKLTVAERELREAQAEIDRLKREADKPNPLQSEVDQLKADKGNLERELSEEKQAHGRTKDELGTTQQQLTEARQSASEPDDQPESPTAAPSDETDQPEPAHDGDSHPGPKPLASPHALTPHQEAERRSLGRRLLDRGRDAIPGHSNPTNTPKDGEK